MNRRPGARLAADNIMQPAPAGGRFPEEKDGNMQGQDFEFTRLVPPEQKWNGRMEGQWPGTGPRCWIEDPTPLNDTCPDNPTPMIWSLKAPADLTEAAALEKWESMWPDFRASLEARGVDRREFAGVLLHAAGQGGMVCTLAPLDLAARA